MLFFSSYAYLPDLHSFPTRRSSDLGPRTGSDERQVRVRGVELRLGRVHGDRAAADVLVADGAGIVDLLDRKSTRLNSSHLGISYAVFCLKKKKVSMNYTNHGNMTIV